MNKKPIKAIGFDYGGVIWKYGDFSLASAIEKVLHIPYDVFRKTYLKYNRLFNTDQATHKEVVGMILSDLGIKGMEDTVENLYIQEWKGGGLNQDIVALNKILLLNGYKTGVLSNNTATIRPEFEREGIFDLFKTVVISGEEGYYKPEREIYERFAKRLGVELDELIFIDDSKSSLRGIEEWGMRGIQYTDHKSLIASLQAEGVICE